MRADLDVLVGGDENDFTPVLLDEDVAEDGDVGVSFDDPADGFDRLEKVFAVANDVLHDGSESEKLPADHLLENVKLVIELGVAQTFLRNLADGVHHRRVVPAPEVFSDLGQAVLSELLREVHGDLARMRDVGRTTLGVHVGHLDLVVVGNRLLDVLDRDEVVDHGELIPKHALATSIVISRCAAGWNCW